MKVFFLSGLGADNTVFQLLDLNYCEPVFIDWIPPQKNESLADYALRLKDMFIPDEATVVGLSFGGMLATEIAKKFPRIKAIILSGAKTATEIPPIYKTGLYFPLHHWSSPAIQKWFMLNIKKLFGITSQQGFRIYEEIIKNSDTVFNRWAINAILNWHNRQVPQNIIHIHGTHDRVLPYKYIHCNYTVEKGGHLMVLEQAEIISELLQNIITQNNFNPTDLSSLTSQFVHQNLR